MTTTTVCGALQSQRQPGESQRLEIAGRYQFHVSLNTVLAANSYLVVAESLTNLLVKYPQLNATNALGNYSGALANSGERIELAKPDDLISTNGALSPRTSFTSR